MNFSSFPVFPHCLQTALRRFTFPLLAACSLAAMWSSSALSAAEFEQMAGRAPVYRGTVPVAAQADGSILLEAEEFQVGKPEEVGWRPGNWGENYYAATFAITFLSRKAFLGAPEQCKRTEATIEMEVPKAGRYLVLARYEACYRFETRFRIRVEQAGQVRLDRPYGGREQPKVWAFHSGVKPEVGWNWGAVENTVWEGDDAFAELQPGRARVTLIAEAQPEPAARRNVDAILLTTDEADVKARIKKEGYLPLDGLLTQTGDVFLKLKNRNARAAVRVTLGNGTEHSPYWVHQRAWKPRTIAADPGQTTGWEEVGSLLDTMNDGQWRVAASSSEKTEALDYVLEFGVKSAAGEIQSIASFPSTAASLELAYDGNTRYSRRIRTSDQVLYDLLGFLKQNPVAGQPPQRTIIYGYTFEERPDDAKFSQARDDFSQQFSLVVRSKKGKGIGRSNAEYIDVRGMGTDKLTAHFDALKAAGTDLAAIRTVSLGDEIGLAAPPVHAAGHAAFREWAKARGLRPEEIVPGAGGDWTKVELTRARDAATKNPRQHYFSQLYGFQYGIENLKQRTDLIRKALPNADTGANFSPHHGAASYLGTAHQWISLFRENGMTMPWAEDYTWQVPIVSQQATFILLDLARAANRYHPKRESHFYVMPHWPGNTPNSWRRLFYGALGHGMTIVNLFEFRPVQAAYTENHVSLPEMFLEVKKGLHELARFEDIVQDGRPRTGNAALWYSEAGDVWHNHSGPFGPNKRSLYLAARHQQLQLDIVDEADALKGTLAGYKVLYLADANVTRAAAQALAKWVEAGGQLFASAGAGMRDEFNEPNVVLQNLFGVQQSSLVVDTNQPIALEKQDLPFASALENVTWISPTGNQYIPVFGAISRITASGAQVVGKFGDQSPAITMKTAGAGRAIYCAFLPGLSYAKPAIPKRPVDRGSTDDAMAHFIPTEFHAATAALIGLPARDVARSVTCSNPLVDASVLEAKSGTAVVLSNWSGKALAGLQVTLAVPVPTAKVELASGGKATLRREGEKTVVTLDLGVGDAIILR